MANENGEKLFSSRDVINMVAKVLGSQPRDLIDEIKEQDLSTTEKLTSFIDPFIVVKKNSQKAAINSEFDKGFRKGNKKAESEILEVFQVDADGKTGADLFMTIKNAVAKEPSGKDKQITPSQAFNVKEVKAKIAEQNKIILGLQDVESNFSKYKNFQGIQSKALGFVNAKGASWSKNAKTRAIQIKAFDTAMQSNQYKLNEDGTVTVFDTDGKTPKHNKKTGENWTLEDWAAQNSPVDFGTPNNNNNDSSSFTPPDGEESTSNFGYSESSMKKFTAADFGKAKDAGKLDEAEFIRTTMYENRKEEK